MWRRTHTKAAAAVLAVVTLTSVGGCAGAKSEPRWSKPAASGSASANPSPTNAGPLSLAVTGPAPGSKGVSTATEILLQTNGATTVELADAAGNKIAGELRGDGTSWVPSKQLAYNTTYTAKVTATKDGKSESKATTFTTMGQPGNLTWTGLYLNEGAYYGVGMPIVIELGAKVALAQRANVERRLFVKSTPPQEGSWHWFADDQIHFRPKDYWQAGTKLSVRLAVGGLWYGGNAFAEKDRVANVNIGNKLVVNVDNATKRMTVHKDDQLLRGDMKVALGKPKTPSSSGNLVVMDKAFTTVFDSSTYGVPVNSPDGYRITAHYTERLTWGGEFIHAAPWSEGDQGIRNVSHGCVNLSTANAEWLFNLVKQGDPVIVKGTEVKVKKGDGWTDWDMTWPEYLKGSALPQPPAASPSPSR